MSFNVERSRTFPEKKVEENQGKKAYKQGDLLHAYDSEAVAAAGRRRLFVLIASVPSDDRSHSLFSPVRARAQADSPQADPWG